MSDKVLSPKYESGETSSCKHQASTAVGREHSFDTHKTSRWYIALVILFFIIATIFCTNRIFPFPQGTEVQADFWSRYGEMLCIKEGINPYKIWDGTLVGKVDEKFKPIPRYVQTGGHHDIVAEIYWIGYYTPWTYFFLHPLTYFEPLTARTIYRWIQIVFLLLIFAGAWVYGKSLRGNVWDALWVGSASCLAGASLSYDIAGGNFGILSTGAAMMMIVCLDRKKPVLAGVCWSIMMMKPQLGLLFAIPLLMRRQWLTCCVAAGICILASIPIAMACHTPLLDMFLQVPAVGKPYFDFTDLIPSYWGLSRETAMLVSPLLGAGICVLMSFWMRRSERWLDACMPAAMCSTLWNYSLHYDRLMLAIPIVFLVGQVILEKSLAKKIFCSLVLALLWSDFLRFFTIEFTFTQKLIEKLPSLLGFMAEDWWRPFVAIFTQTARVVALLLLGVIAYTMRPKLPFKGEL